MSDGLAGRAIRRAAAAVAQVAAGAANALASQAVGISQTVVSIISPQPQNLGVSVTPAPLRALAGQAVGIAQSLIASASTRAAQGIGIAQATVTDLQRLPQSPGVKVALAAHSLTHLSGGTSGASTGTAWTGPGNALGVHNGTFATLTGSATAAVDGTFTLSYAAQPTRGDLALGSHALLWWVKLAGAVTGVTVTAEYSLDGGTTWVNAFTWTANTDATATPVTTTLAATWAQLSQLKTRVRFQAPSVTAATATASLDAVELQLAASRPADL